MSEAKADKKPVAKPVNPVWIQPMDLLEQDVVVAQQQNRPFEVIQSLPLSQDPPQYESFSNELSMKDSAVLYNSLIASRHNWINYVFEAYWRRNQLYGTVPTADRKKDKMSKICESRMLAGPHTFDIRLYLLKDDEKERKRQEEIDQKKEARRKAQEAAAQRAAQQPATVEAIQSKPAEGTSATTKKLDISKEATKEGSNGDGKSSTDKDESMDSADATETTEDIKKKSEEAKSDDAAHSKTGSEVIEESSVNGEAAKGNVKEAKKTSDSESEPEVKSTPKKSALSEKKVDASSTAAEGSSVVATPATKDVPKPTFLKTTPAVVPKQPIPPATVSAPTRDDIMSSPENHIMISNLNTIARNNPALNALMKVVASGKASHEQIMEFQKYIQKAREMGDVNGYYKKWQEQQKQLQIQQRLEIQRRNERMRQQQLAQAKLRAAAQAQAKAKAKAEAAARNKEVKLTAFQERYVNDATLVFEFSENASLRFYLPKNAIIDVHDKPEGTKEEAKDAKESTPVKAELGEGAKDTPRPETKESTPKPADSRESTPKPDESVSEERKRPKFVPEIVISFLAIHNQHEIDEYDHKQKEAELEKKRLEEEKLTKAEQAKAVKIETETEIETEESQVSTPRRRPHRRPKRWSVVRRSTRQNSGEVKREEPEVTDERVLERPVPKYSCLTIKLVDVPLRFFPMIKNSVNPREKVLEYMEEIRKTGERSEDMNVWFHLDGVKDELLAETLRYHLNRIDYTLGGNKQKSKAMLKRLVEGTEQPTPTKKQKT